MRIVAAKVLFVAISSIARIQASPFIPVKASVRGFVYDVHDGTLREVEAA